MPLTAMISSISSEHVAGPIVATILVRLVLLKPAMVRCTTFLSLREVHYLSGLPEEQA